MAVQFYPERNKWRVRFSVDGKRTQKWFDNERDAMEWEAGANPTSVSPLRQMLASRREDGSLQCMVATCAKADWAGKDPSQLENAVRLAKLLGPSTHIGELTTRRLDDLVEDLRASGLSNTTIKKYISAASVMLKRACRLGYIDAMPLMPEKRTLRSPEPRDLVIRDEWMAALLDALERKENRLSLGLTIFLREMGCRVGEALDLTWDRVDLDKGEVQFVKTKGAMPRRLPLTGPALGVVKTMRARGSERVFPTCYGTFLSHYSDAKHVACDQLGLGPTVRKEWVIHTLRHTRITELAANGHAAPAIQAWAGHASLSVTQRYIHAAGINLTALAHC